MAVIIPLLSLIYYDYNTAALTCLNGLGQHFHTLESSHFLFLFPSLIISGCGFKHFFRKLTTTVQQELVGKYHSNTSNVGQQYLLLILKNRESVMDTVHI